MNNADVKLILIFKLLIIYIHFLQLTRFLNEKNVIFL